MRRIAIALLAVLVVGCGSVTNRARTSTTRTVATPSAASVPSTASTAAGFARYEANGFSFLAPSGLKAGPDAGVGGLPPGVSAHFMTPGGKRLARTNTQIMVGINPHLRADLGAVATRLAAADANSPALTHVQTHISTMTVAGAQDVRIVDESYVGPGGGGTRTLFRRTWLMVLPKPGLLMDLVVVNEPRRGGHLNPAGVLGSFRLDHPG